MRDAEHHIPLLPFLPEAKAPMKVKQAIKDGAVLEIGGVATEIPAGKRGLWPLSGT